MSYAVRETKKTSDCERTDEANRSLQFPYMYITYMPSSHIRCDRRVLFRIFVHADEVVRFLLGQRSQIPVTYKYYWMFFRARNTLEKNV